MDIKKIVSVLAIATVANVWSATWYDASTGYTWTYRINGDTAVIYGTYNNSTYTPAISPKPTGTVTIPSTLGGKPVTSIGNYAFYGCSGLTSVTIPDSVTRIGYRAFSGCSELTSVTIPDSVTSIDYAAFYGCTGLQGVCISDIGAWCRVSFSTVDANPLYYAHTLYVDANQVENLTIPDDIANVKQYVFYGCTNIVSVTIPDSVTSIGSSAFGNCTGLKRVYVSDLESWCGISFSTVDANPLYYANTLYVDGMRVENLTIPDEIASVKGSAFCGCTSIVSVTIPDGVTRIGDYAFYGCSGLASVTIGDSVTSIGDNAFYKCIGLMSVTIPDGVTRIGDYAFYGCSGLASVTIGDSVTSIGDRAFHDCNPTLFDTTTIPGVRLVDGWVVDSTDLLKGSPNLTSIRGIGPDAFSGRIDLTSVTIPDSVTIIAHSAFSGCSSLTSVTMPDSITNIGWSAFYQCSSLTSVTIPDSVTVIEHSAFSGCSELTSMTIPDSVTRIGGWAFLNCSNLTSVRMGCGVKYLGESAFYGCSKLHSVFISDIAAWCTMYFDSYSYEPFSTNYDLYLNDLLVTDLVVPYGVTNISSLAFARCDSLTSVSIPDSVTSLDYSTFYECNGLTNISFNISDLVTWCANDNNISEDLLRSVVFTGGFVDGAGITDLVVPDGVTNIGNRKFFGWKSLTSVTIPDGVANIGEGAFSDCYGLTNVVMSDSVTDIGRCAFSGCSSLTNVTIGNSVTSIGAWAFSYCSGLTNVTIPDSVTSIEGYAFYGCSGLTSVTIPDNVTSIGWGAFYDCSGLTNVIIGNSVTNIESYAFCKCVSLTSVLIPENVISVDYFAFEGCSALQQVWIPDFAEFDIWVSPNTQIIRYKTNRLIVAFDAAGGVVSLESIVGRSGEPYGELPVPTKVGHQFSGWMYNGAIIDNDSLITALDNHVLVAEWVANKYLVSFNANGGEGGISGAQDYGTVIVEPTVTRIGYTFCGWDKEVAATVPDNDVTYNAQWMINQYVVTFDANGGNGGTCSEQDYNSPIVAPSVSRDGYTFTGWLPEVDAVVPANDVTYVAQWTINKHNVTFDANGGIGGWSEARDYGTAIVAPTVTRTGYTFKGWDKGIVATVPDEDVTYTAQWEINQYSVTFDANGGEGGTSGEQDYNSPIVAPIVSRVGYTFAGWSPEVDAVVPAQDVTYVAQWTINKHTVTFDANGGLGGTSNEQDYGTTIIAPTVSRTGYTFKGWDKEIAATVPDEDVTYTAQWEINQYSVTFDANGGEGGTSGEQDYNSPIVAPSVSRVGYTFAGWLPEVDAVVPANNITYLAQWTINKHTVAFDANGGTGGTSAVMDYSTAIVAPTVSRTGYTFKGWDKEVAATVPDEDVTYIAQWAINQYTVTFDANGGVGGWSARQDYDSAIVPPAVSRFGCTFERWSPSPDAKVPTHDVTYVAQWKVWDIKVDSTASSVKELYPDDYFRITNIVIGAEVECLPVGFFDGCDALESLTFLSPDTELGDNDLRTVGKLFANQPDGYWVVQGVLLGYKGDCPREIPELDSIKRVFDGALEGCTALEELNFTAESVLSTIGTNAFKHCTELQRMTLPPSLEEIGDEAFMGCSYLGNVIVPGGVKHVGDRAFKNCTGFTAAQIEYGVESLGEEAFHGDWRISEVDIPSTVTNIGVNAFGGDSSMIRIGLRGDVRKASEIFSNYKHIREATVKDGDGEIVDGLFSGFSSLHDVHFQGNCPALANDGLLLYKDTPDRTVDYGDGYVINALVTYVEQDSTGWDGTPGSHSLPQAWPLAGSYRRSIAWWDVPTYLCQFDANGGTLGVQDTYQYSEKLIMLPPEPVQTGYRFAGWWTQPIGGLPVTEDTIFIEGVYTHLYAHWIKGHWVFLDPDGGTVVNDFITYVEESVYGVLPVPVKSGYAFGGWLYNGYRIEPETEINEKADHTLVAQWIANLYSVRYDANGGDGDMEEQGFVYGVEQELRKNIFTRSGYEFIGWATNAVDAVGLEEETDAVVYADCEAVSNLTAVADGWVELYAVWRESDVLPDPSNLEFHFSGGARWELRYEGVTVEKDGETLRYATVWRSGSITNNLKSVLIANVYGAGKIGFWWKVSCESFRDYKLDNLEFAIDGVAQEPWINGERDWTYLEFEVDTSGEHVLTWTYSKDEEGSDGEDCGWITAAVWTPRLESLGDYVNCPTIGFSSSGGAQWQGDEANSHDGIASLRSGAIGDGEISALEAEVEGAGRIGFWWKVSSEKFRNQKIDYVSFSVDDVEQDWIGGEIGWTNVAFDVLGNGVHTLRWEYHKDEEGSSGEDCAWLDEVLWMPSPVDDPIPVISSDDEVESALQGSTDANLTTFVTNVATYAEYREWAQSVKGSDGETPVGAAAVKASDKAWMSFALGADKLIEEEITKEDVTIDSFEPSAEEPGSFSFEVSIKDVNIGSDADKERLATVLGIEGSSSLDDSSFSSGNVDFDIGTPKDGKATFTAKPKEEAKGDGGAFFMRVRVNQ